MDVEGRERGPDVLPGPAAVPALGEHVVPGDHDRSVGGWVQAHRVGASAERLPAPPAVGGRQHAPVVAEQEPVRVRADERERMNVLCREHAPGHGGAASRAKHEEDPGADDEDADQ